jgi:hypothetical protein
MSPDSRKWLSTSEIAALIGLSRRHVSRMFFEIPKRHWLYAKRILVNAGGNYRFMDSPFLRHWCVNMGLHVRRIPVREYSLKCAAYFFSTGRDVSNNPGATREMPPLPRSALRAAAAFLQSLDKDSLVWGEGYWDKEDGAMVWHDPGWEFALPESGGFNPAAEASFAGLRELTGKSEYQAEIDEAAERQRSGEERRESHWRKIEEVNYASTAAEN